MSRPQFSNSNPFLYTGFVDWFTQCWPESKSAFREMELYTHYRLCDGYIMNGGGLIINVVLTQHELMCYNCVKQMNLKSINIVTVVFAPNAGFVFTVVLMWNGEYGIERGAVEWWLIGSIYYFTWEYTIEQDFQWYKVILHQNNSNLQKYYIKVHLQNFCLLLH